MNNHRKHRPQVRKIRSEVLPEAGPATPEALIDYDDLMALFEVEQIQSGGSVETLPGVMMLRNVTALSDPDNPISHDDMRVATLMTAEAIHLAIDGLKTQGFDLMKDRNAISGAGRQKLFELVTSIASKSKRYFDLSPLGQLAVTAQLNLFDIMVAKSAIINSSLYNDFESNNLAKQAALLFDVEADSLENPAESYITQKRRLYQKSALNPSGFKNETHRQLVKINSPPVRAFVDAELDKYENDWLGWYDDEPATPNQLSDPELFAGQELDFTILPAGTSIREYTEAIYDGLSDSQKAYVDIERVSVLEKIRGAIGRERCYYVHGKQSDRTMTDEESGLEINVDYIGLVMQSYDPKGIVSGEDAIMVSPIAKKHAGYLFRHDYSQQTSWRETLAKSKLEAKANGARPLKFTHVTGKDTYEAFAAKALELLTCPAEQFGPDYDLSLKKNGEYMMRKRLHRSLGELALKASSVNL